MYNGHYIILYIRGENYLLSINEKLLCLLGSFRKEINNAVIDSNCRLQVHLVFENKPLSSFNQEKITEKIMSREVKPNENKPKKIFCTFYQKI